MKKLLVIITLLGCIAFGFSCNEKPGNVSKRELKTQQEKYSYIIGLDMGRTLKGLNTGIDRKTLGWGVEDALTGQRLLMADTQIVRVRQELVRELAGKKNDSLKASEEKNPK